MKRYQATRLCHTVFFHDISIHHSVKQEAATGDATGGSAAIGAQGARSYFQYELNIPDEVYEGTRLAIDTNCQGSITVG
ncbi:uncharacterized protein IL334_000557 [Kwoniella shivajii]|uniref:Uncharacterized protein n=1 Tax=Kwoniella shivajii TaxID=564305 RepID=A0ABZ1CQY1_9TREE|nr:hypothetical protein IL334_000557 [Kwoniella shivajii]